MQGGNKKETNTFFFQDCEFILYPEILRDNNGRSCRNKTKDKWKRNLCFEKLQKKWAKKKNLSAVHNKSCKFDRSKKKKVFLYFFPFFGRIQGLEGLGNPYHGWNECADVSSMNLINSRFFCFSNFVTVCNLFRF